MLSTWIKIDHTLPDKPEVARLADLLHLDPDAVVGRLVRWFIWLDLHANCNAVSVTCAFLDHHVRTPGFAAALSQVGWLTGSDGRFEITNFERHNGKSAKRRALGKNRTAAARERVTDTTRPSNAQSVTVCAPDEDEDEDLLKHSAAKIIPQPATTTGPAVSAGGAGAVSVEIADIELEPTSTTKERKRDPAFEAMASVCGQDPLKCTEAFRGPANRALREIAAITAPAIVADRAAFGAEILRRVRRYHDLWPWKGAFGPMALAKEWSALDGQGPNRRDTARRKATETPYRPPPAVVGSPPPAGGNAFAEALRAVPDRGLQTAVGT